MLVILKRLWFDPLGHRHRRSIPADNPIVLDDSLREFLPNNAKVVDDDYVPSAAPESPETLSEGAMLLGADPDRAAGDSEDIARKKAEDFKRELDAGKKARGKKKS